uniref:Uncharacterized protein n=2 Tax=Ciona intestinalis TaxID=7719 RepID=F6RKF9_CIOIN
MGCTHSSNTAHAGAVQNNRDGNMSDNVASNANQQGAVHFYKLEQEPKNILKRMSSNKTLLNNVKLVEVEEPLIEKDEPQETLINGKIIRIKNEIYIKGITFGPEREENESTTEQ